MADQLFFGSLYGSPLGAGSNSVIRFNGSIAGNTVTEDSAISGYLGFSSVTVGMIVNNVLTVNDITGSNNTNFLPSSSQYAIHGKADGKTGIFHQYLITNVTQRDSGSSTISFFAEWNESGSEADTGDSLTSNAQYMAVHELSHEYKIAPNLSRRVGDLTNLEVGADQAGYNISLDNFDDLNTGSFTGSFHGEVTGSLTGSFVGEGSGSFTGSYTGSVRSTDLIATGSFTGSGHIDLANTASSADDFFVRQDLTVVGTGSFGFIQTTYTSASVIYSSGSTKFGDTNDDVHQITGSISLSGSNVDFLDSTGVSGSFSGSLEGEGSGVTGVISSSYATSSSLADTGSHATFAEDANSSSFASNASTADTASHATFAVTANTALTASAVSFSELNQDLDVNGVLTISGSTNSGPSLVVENGILQLVNIPTYTSDAAAAAGGVPINGIYKSGNFLIIRTV